MKNDCRGTFMNSSDDLPDICTTLQIILIRLFLSKNMTAQLFTSVGINDTVTCEDRLVS